jgi:hypothetical protein
VFLGHEWAGHSFCELVILTPDVRKKKEGEEKAAVEMTVAGVLADNEATEDDGADRSEDGANSEESKEGDKTKGGDAGRE